MLSLEDCFNDFICAETIADSECEKCNLKTDREKSLSVWRFPPILVQYFYYFNNFFIKFLKKKTFIFWKF